MNDEIGKEAELKRLAELCRSLAKLGLGVQIRDAAPALTVTAGPKATGGIAAHVMLNPSGSRFAWWHVDNSHPVHDVNGAARRVAEFVRRQSPRPDES